MEFYDPLQVPDPDEWLALDEQERVQQVTLERLLREGLDRHEAIHAIGSVLSEQIFNVMKNPSAQKNPNKAYIRRLKKLTAMVWLSGGH